MTYPTPFRRVAQLNRDFGNRTLDPKMLVTLHPEHTEARQKAWGYVIAQCKGIKEEYEELMHAASEENLPEVRDALCDIMVFALGAYQRMGLDADEDMRLVVEALYTRFCRDEAHQAATAHHYQANVHLAIELGRTNNRLWVKSAIDQTGADGAFYAKGKFLKALGYTNPDLTRL